MTQTTMTPEDYFSFCFEPLGPEEESALDTNAHTTCISCGRPFRITLDDPHRAICDDCLRDGYERGRSGR
jgi:hypothetical protein